MRPRFGIVLGRFQPPHLNHFREYILPALELCDLLVIGITNPEPELTRHDDINPHRSEGSANPYSYWQRLEMIKAALINDYQIPRDPFEFAPAPINYPGRMANYMPKGATYFITAYDAWGKKKFDEMKAQGFETVMLWEKDESEKTISGSTIRQLMAQKKPWEHLVPASVAALLK